MFKRKKDKNVVRVTWADEKKNMQGMTFRQKLDHLWTYYNEFVWIGAVVLILVSAIITSTINLAFRETIVTGMNINVTMDQAGMSYLGSEYHEKIGARDYWDKVNIEYTQFNPLLEITGDEGDYYASQAVVAKVASEMVDYFLLDQESLDYFARQDIFGDLTEFFTPEELKAMEEAKLLRYAETGVEGDDVWVIAVDITDTAYMKDNSTTEGKVYFALAGNAPHMDQCRAIWDYINAWGK